MSMRLFFTNTRFLHSSRQYVSRTRCVSSRAYRQRLEVNSTAELDVRASLPSQPKIRYHGTSKDHKLKKTKGEINTKFKDHDKEPAPKGSLQQLLDHPSASIILRDACKCSKCKDSGTGQREFNVAHIPTDINPASIEKDREGNWKIHWQDDMPGWEDHTSVFTPHDLDRLRTYMQKEHQMAARLWNKEEYERDRHIVTYDEFLSSDTALAKALYYFTLHGLILIKDIPSDEHAVARLATRIGPIKSTFYGPTWDIKSIPNARNVAFTNKHLGFHADLMYIKEPPTAQFLHCIHNSCSGGESRFVDQFKAFDTLLSEDPDLAHVLTTTHLRYEYENDGFYYSDIKPIVQLRTHTHQFPSRSIRGATSSTLFQGQVYRMYWSPPFLGSIVSDLNVSSSSLEQSVAAMKKYADILEREELIFQEKMIPGTCVLFDNLRVLHARNEFDMNTGERWLRGTYLDAQELWSKEMQLKDYVNGIERDGQMI